MEVIDGVGDVLGFLPRLTAAPIGRKAGDYDKGTVWPLSEDMKKCFVGCLVSIILYVDSYCL